VCLAEVGVGPVELARERRFLAASEVGVVTDAREALRTVLAAELVVVGVLETPVVLVLGDTVVAGLRAAAVVLEVVLETLVVGLVGEAPVLLGATDVRRDAVVDLASISEEDGRVRGEAVVAEATVEVRLGALEMLAGRVVVLLAAVPVVLVRLAEEAVGFVAVEVPVAVRRAVAVVPGVPVAVRFAAVVGEDVLGLAPLLGDAAVGFASASTGASASASASAVSLVDGSSAGGGGEGALTDCSASDWGGSDWVGVGASTCSTTSMVLSASDMLGYLLIVGRREVACKSSA